MTGVVRRTAAEFLTLVRPPSTGRVAVIGDLSGYLQPLLPTLSELGIDTDAAFIPTDLTVIQLGDLIHKGSQSSSIVALVDRLMRANPGQWIQLVGNHESQHLGGPSFFKCTCDPALLTTLRGWASDGLLHLAVSVNAAEGDYLATHAGLGRPLWERLGRPATASEATISLNRSLRSDPGGAFASGTMLGGTLPSKAPGVVWAHTPTEVYSTWQQMGDAPFSQLHGHVCPYLWPQKKWADSTPQEFRDDDAVDFRRRFLTTHCGGQIFVALDPGFTARSAAPRHFAWVIDGVASAID